jgi:hypothetical protein
MTGRETADRGARRHRLAAVLGATVGALGVVAGTMTIDNWRATARAFADDWFRVLLTRSADSRC